MRIASLSKLILVCALFALLFVPLRAGAAVPSERTAKMLPDTLGDFRAQGAMSGPQDSFQDYLLRADGALSAAQRNYTSAKGEKFQVLLIQMSSDSAAYALLTNLTRGEDKIPLVIQTGDVGTASVNRGSISFFKGQNFVDVKQLNVSHINTEAVKAVARSLSDTLDRGDGDIPVLVKHLPDWERAQARAAYALSLDGLLKLVGHQPVLEAVSFEGGAEAVTSNYGPSRLVIVEHTTPQIATDSDARITERIKQLQDAGQPLPSAYRRVGNYSVFVFDAPDERAAAQLVDQINYEQTVQWLGTNPYILQRAQRDYVNTMGGTILAVIKASGLSLVVCFGIGGLVGALVFKRRRAQAAAIDAYSDAGGMLRLNIDEMTRQTDPGRLLGRGEG
ncbi:MAG TPA: DUF6599 family protein [Pyrinomonadaceae bacterium]|nr:DUF6599 family protein [Pyrinomonadaceae bacterium]